MFLCKRYFVCVRNPLILLLFFVYFQDIMQITSEYYNVNCEHDNVNSEFVTLDPSHRSYQAIDDENESDHDGRLNQQRNDYVLGIFIMVISVVCDCGSTICTQALGRIIPQFELNMWRFALQPFFVLPIIHCKKMPLRFPRNNIPDVVFICLLFNIYNAFFYTATTYLPLGTISGIHSAFILVIVAIVTVVISKECSFYTVCSVVLCITGLILISQPRFIFSGIYSDRNISHFYTPICHNSMNQTIHNSVPNEGLGYAMLAITACAASTTLFKTRQVKEEVGAFVISFWVGISGTVVSPLLMFIFQDSVFPTAPMCQLLLLGHAIFTVLSTVGFLNALHLINPLLFTLLRSSQIILLCISQYTFMKDVNPGRQNIIEITGVMTVFVGIIITPTYELYLQYCKFQWKYFQ